MIGEQQSGFPIDAVIDVSQMVAEHAFLEQLFLEPDRDRLAERLKPPRRKCKIGLEQAFEFQKRLFVKHDMVEFICADPCLGEAIANGGRGKGRIVLPAREPLFLGGGDDVAVDHEGRSAVVVECRNPEDAHGRPSEQRIDERCQR